MTLISPKAAAKLAGVSESLVYEWVRRRLLRHYRFGANGKGGKIQIDVTDLEAFLASCRVEAGEDEADDGPLEYIR